LGLTHSLGLECGLVRMGPFLCCIRADDIFCKKNQTMRCLIFSKSGRCNGQKIRPNGYLTQKSIFKIFFNPRHPENILETMINLFIAYKNLKIISKPEINLKKNLPELRYFLGYFKVKKSPNMNSPHQMEPFNRKIECFGALNLHQQYFLSLHLNPTTSLFSLKLMTKK